jgi:hypothetical protein
MESSYDKNARYTTAKSSMGTKPRGHRMVRLKNDGTTSFERKLNMPIRPKP